MKCSKANRTAWTFLFLVPGVLALAIACTDWQCWAQEIVIHEEAEEAASEVPVQNEAAAKDELECPPSAMPMISGLDRTKDLGAKGEIIIESLDLIEADLGNVLRAIGRLAGLNIIAGEDVQGKVTVYWENVTVQQALSSILTTNDYGYIYEGNILKVLPAKKLGEDRISTVTRVVTLQYLNAEEMKEAIEELTGSSGGGGGGGGGRSQQGSASLKVGLQLEANALIITGIPKEVEEIVNIIRSMDQPTRQVRIEARLLELTYEENSSMGMDWSVYRDFDNIGDYSALLGTFNLAPGGTQAGVFDFAYGKDPYTLIAKLQATYGEDHVKVLANPNILALDNQEAIIQILDQRPYITVDVSQGVVTEKVNYQETGITLLVTPHITEDGHVRMHVKPTQRIAGPTVVLQNSTAFNVNERTAETDLLVKDGSTVVIGGLKRVDEQTSIQKVPLLGDIPAIGKLFTRQTSEETETELVVFVTPHIIQLGEMLMSESENQVLMESNQTLDGVEKLRSQRIEAERRRDTPVYRVHMDQSMEQ